MRWSMIGAVVLTLAACSDGGGAGDGGGEPADGGGPEGGSGATGGGGTGGQPATLPENFACLEGFTAPEPGTVVVTVRLEDAVAAPGTAPRNATAVLCAANDASCARPLDTPAIDGSGSFSVEVAPHFQGYLRVTGQVTDAESDAMPTTIFFKPPVIVPGKELVVRMVDEASFTALAEAAGVTLDPARGHVLALITDCADDRAEGISIAGDPIDDEVIPFYFRGALPDPAALDTDDQGAAGFFNVQAGALAVTIALATGGTFIGTNEVVVEAGGLAVVPLGPTAR